MKIQTEGKNKEELIKIIKDLEEMYELEKELSILRKECLEINEDIFVSKRRSIIIHLRQVEGILNE